MLSIALGVGVTLLAGLLPALSASRVTPIEVLRPSLGDTAQRVSRSGTILGALEHIRQHLDNASLRRARSEEV